MVAGFRQWQSKGRQVRKGEKSIKIFGYREKKATRDDNERDIAQNDVIFPRFLGQFDVSFQAARVTVVGTIFS